MRLFTLAAMAASAAAFGLGASQPARAGSAPTLSGPFVHDNLAVFFIHGPSAAGPVPLTLAEALAQDAVEVRETGSVNNLEIENKSDAAVFIQAGDIVKGGQQDRVLMMSMLLPAHSGKVAIGSFCVEQGRWSRRGSEDVKRFASSAEALPSREAKLAMKAPPKAAPPPDASAGVRPAARTVDDVGTRQHEVWAAVAAVQNKLSDRLGGPVAAKQSATSLQLSLENEKLAARRAAYITELESKASDADIVGYVFVVNGHVNSADQYPSNALFRKMWPKQLIAGATEAIGEAAKLATAAAPAPAPALAEVADFLTRASAAPAEEKPVGTIARQELRDSAAAVYVEAKSVDGTVIHRSYVAK